MNAAWLARMNVAAKDYAHHIAEAPYGAQTIEVSALSVDTIRRRLGWSRIGPVKIDIEGYEQTLPAHDCEWLNDVDSVCIECHDGFGETQLAAVAQRLGFLPPAVNRGLWLLTRSEVRRS